ncbi:MAG: metallophosphoesterase family protein [Lachnospiraceae bacterium]|nr:metallophosphoesterase family protein [Lachnospiraceae bacterium]
MKILVVADEESKALWDFYDRKKTEGVDLIISCGDLHSDYLQFLVTMVNCPLLYVRGNHDRGYDKRPPEGCICIDDTVYDHEGLRILGLGGSMRYRPGPCMCTEEEMQKRVRKAEKTIRKMNGFDILVTHAPAKDYGDLEDLPHRGFECFNELMEKYRPHYMLHGHVHQSYGRGFKRTMVHECGTVIINACGSYIFEVADDEHPPYGGTGSVFYDLGCRIRMKRRKY